MTVQPKGNLTNEDIDWLLEMSDPSIDDGYCQSIIDKLESLKIDN